MISGVMIVKSGEKVQLVRDYKPTTLLYYRRTVHYLSILKNIG